jgi:hypothetical protein
MVHRLRSRMTYANVMATIAVFIALATGGAYAANEWNGSNIQDGTLTGADIQDLSLGLPDYGANSISTGKLKDGDVRTQDLRDLGVTNPKIAWDSVSSGKVINNNLTGDDINESTLRGVPKAARAYGEIRPGNPPTVDAKSVGITGATRQFSTDCVNVDASIDLSTATVLVSKLYEVDGRGGSVTAWPNSCSNALGQGIQVDQFKNDGTESADPYALIVM